MSGLAEMNRGHIKHHSIQAHHCFVQIISSRTGTFPAWKGRCLCFKVVLIPKRFSLLKVTEKTVSLVQVCFFYGNMNTLCVSCNAVFFYPQGHFTNHSMIL